MQSLWSWAPRLPDILQWLASAHNTRQRPFRHLLGNLSTLPAWRYPSPSSKHFSWHFVMPLVKLAFMKASMTKRALAISLTLTSEITTSIVLAQTALTMLPQMDACWSNTRIIRVTIMLFGVEPPNLALGAFGLLGTTEPALWSWAGTKSCLGVNTTTFKERARFGAAMINGLTTRMIGFLADRVRKRKFSCRYLACLV